LLFSFLLPSALFSQEILTFIAERETTAFNRGEDDTDDTITLHVGDIITSNADISFWMLHVIKTPNFHLLLRFERANRRYAVFAKDFRPLNTEDVFGDDIFIDYPMDRSDPNFINTWGEPPAAIGDAMWVPVYYADILRGQNRNMLLEIHPRLEIQDRDRNPWYLNSVVNLQHGRAMFYNSVIRLGMGTHLAVRNIIRTDFGYVVDSVISIRDQYRRWPGVLLYASAFWEQYQLGDPVTLFLYIDGDYLDIYADGNDIHVGTFIRVGREFITQYQSLIKTNISDLTNVQWPRRAEGSTGIPPVFVVPDNFRNETLEVTEEHVTNDIENQESAIAQDDTSASSMPLWVWFVIIGGVVAGGIVVVLVVMRKR